MTCISYLSACMIGSSEQRSYIIGRVRNPAIRKRDGDGGWYSLVLERLARACRACVVLFGESDDAPCMLDYMCVYALHKGGGRTIGIKRNATQPWGFVFETFILITPREHIEIVPLLTTYRTPRRDEILLYINVILVSFYRVFGYGTFA